MRVQHSSCAQVQKRVLVFCCLHGSTVQFKKKKKNSRQVSLVALAFCDCLLYRTVFFFFGIVPFFLLFMMFAEPDTLNNGHINHPSLFSKESTDA